MLTAIKYALIRFAGSAAAKWLFGILAVALTAWAVKSNYVPKADLRASEMQVATLNAQLLRQQERIEETEKLRLEDRARIKELNRHFDQIRDHEKRLDDAETQTWRGTRVPGPVNDRLRNLTPDH